MKAAIGKRDRGGDGWREKRSLRSKQNADDEKLCWVCKCGLVNERETAACVAIVSPHYPPLRGGGAAVSVCEEVARGRQRHHSWKEEGSTKG